MRTLPDPGFAGDRGDVDPAVAAALTAYAGDDADAAYLGVLAALQRSRVLVPVVAVAGEVEQRPGGRTQEKTADMATVLIAAADGARAMLAFTGLGTLAAWSRDARPVPVGVPDAARAALQDDAEALVVDLAGPVRFVIEHEDLTSLAAGDRLTRLGDRWAWVRAATERRPLPGE